VINQPNTIDITGKYFFQAYFIIGLGCSTKNLLWCIVLWFVQWWCIDCRTRRNRRKVIKRYFNKKGKESIVDL